MHLSKKCMVKSNNFHIVCYLPFIQQKLLRGPRVHPHLLQVLGQKGDSDDLLSPVGHAGVRNIF